MSLNIYPGMKLHFSIDRFYFVYFNGLCIHPISSSGGFKDVLELTHTGGNDSQFDFLMVVCHCS